MKMTETQIAEFIKTQIAEMRIADTHGMIAQDATIVANECNSATYSNEARTKREVCDFLASF